VCRFRRLTVPSGKYGDIRRISARRCGLHRPTAPGPSFPLLAQWISGLGSADLERDGTMSATVLLLLRYFQAVRVWKIFGSHSYSRRLASKVQTDRPASRSAGIAIARDRTYQPALEHRDIILITVPTDHENFPAMGSYQTFHEGIVGIGHRRARLFKALTSSCSGFDKIFHSPVIITMRAK
jgi:hypothetical protein